jgi:hypothetical protein
MPDPTIEAARGILDGSLNEIREAIVGLPPDALGWRPAGEEDTNSIVVLTVHAMHSTRWWLSVALGAAEPERDRPSEFRASAADADELLSFFDPMAADCRALVAEDPVFEPGRVRPDPGTGDDTGTAAWALLHALEHLREHVAQASLTRQLWEARPAAR